MVHCPLNKNLTQHFSENQPIWNDGITVSFHTLFNTKWNINGVKSERYLLYWYQNRLTPHYEKYDRLKPCFVKRNLHSERRKLDSHGWNREIFLVYKVESKYVQSKQSLIGLHKEVVRLSSMRTRSRDDDQQVVVSNTGEIFFSSVPDGVFNLVTSFSSLKEFGRLH